MKSIRKFIGQPLKWAQTGTGCREYELRAGDDVLAALRWQKMWGSLALGEAAEGSWTFKRGGFLSPKVTVRAAGTESEVATLGMSWGEGTLSCTSGTRYQWQKISFWRGEWAFTNYTGQPLLSFTPEFAFFKHCAALDIRDIALDIPELPLMALLGWYVMILMADDSASASVATVATVT